MKKIFSVILSLVILVTSMGFTVSSHICGGKEVKTEYAMTITDVSCGMEQEENNCASGMQLKSNCCQDQFRLIQMDEDYTQELTPIDFSIDFSIIIITTLLDLVPSTSLQTTFYKDYSPPPLIRDIPVMVQSFLI